MSYSDWLAMPLFMRMSDLLRPQLEIRGEVLGLDSQEAGTLLIVLTRCASQGGKMFLYTLDYSVEVLVE